MTGSSLPRARLRGDVLGVLFQRLELAFRSLVGDALRPTQLRQRLQHSIMRHTRSRQRMPTGSVRWSVNDSSRCSVEMNSSLKCLASLSA